MTVCLQQQSGNGYYASLEWDKGNYFIVQACPVRRDHPEMVGYPVAECIYGPQELAKAKRTYRRYVKKYVTETEE